MISEQVEPSSIRTSVEIYGWEHEKTTKTSYAILAGVILFEGGRR